MEAKLARRNRVAAGFVFAVVSMNLTSSPVSGQDAPATPAGVSVDVLEWGERIFKGPGNCWACHGEDGAGARGVGADLTDEDWWHADGTYRSIIERIKKGVSADSARNTLGAAMPPRGGASISDEQVRAVAAYVWSLSRRE